MNGDAVRALIEKVEAGTLDCQDDWRWMCDMFPMSQVEVVNGDWESDTVANIRYAYSGSLDAAKRLHDALLPGWEVDDIGQNARLAGSPWGCKLVRYEKGAPVQVARAGYGGYHGKDLDADYTPARAWLLAILRALSDGEGGA